VQRITFKILQGQILKDGRVKTWQIVKKIITVYY